MEATKNGAISTSMSIRLQIDNLLQVLNTLLSGDSREMEMKRELHQLMVDAGLRHGVRR